METNPSIEDALILWADIVSMSADMGDPQLPLWLERLTPVSFDDGVLTLSTRQKWTERKVMTEYRDVVEHLLFETTLEPIKINVVIGDAAAHLDAEPQPAQPAEKPARRPEPPAEKPAPQVAAAPQPAPAPLPDPAPAAPAPEQPHTLSAAALAGAEYAAAHAGRQRPGEAAAEQQIPSYTPGLSPAQLAAREVMGMSGAKAEPAPIIDSRTLPTRDAALDASSEVEQAAAVPMPVLGDGAMPRAAVATGFTDFSFDTYVVGEANTVAYSMALAVAEQPGNFQNPLFIWGPSGNGKTHLLLSIINYIHEHQPAMNTRYVSATTFVNQYVDDLSRKKKGSEVLKEYRDIDVLLVDDVQSFKDKQETVSTFFEIFNQLILDGRQIVLAADRAPDYLELDQRMQTRFGQGLVVDIKAPTYEMKRSILMSFYERYRARKEWSSVAISPDLFDVIAQLAPNNPRSMQGLVNTLMATADADPSVLTPDGVRSIISNLFRSRTAVDIPTILKIVSDHYGVSVDELRSKSRRQAISQARQVAMWMARQLTDESYENIGAAVGGRDHSTVYYSVTAVQTKQLNDRSYAYELDRLKKEIMGPESQ
jgi:chromosomal replication initiator protein